MDTCLITDFEKVCRICMKFDKTFLAITSFKIIDMIIACASVQIWENDDLPNQICQACFLQLQNTINFKQLCENSDNTFRQIIQQSKINLSNNENNFHSVKDEKFEDYADDDHSLGDVKEEDISEDIKNENTLENVKINIGHNEDDSKKLDTNSILEITNKDKSEEDKISRTELEKESGETITDEVNVIESFTCEKCKKEFKTVWVLGKHMQNKHKAKPLKCDKCEIKFYHPLHLQGHKEMAHDPVNLTCNKCNKLFKNIYKLKDHKLTHLLESLYCERCDKKFKDKQELKNHNRDEHPDIEIYTACHICGKLIRKRRLADHLVTHQERNKVTCNICSKTFVRNSSLTVHIKEVHEKKRPPRNHLCNICGFATITASKLRKHLVVHSNEKPHACDRCDKAYRRADHLKQHIAQAHLNIRKYQCTFCTHAFFTKRNLTHHVRRHTGEKPHKCEVCGKGFVQKDAMKTHMKIHTSKENIIQS
ncbi:zinc finger protein OZF-like isoform X1 [Chrysoperla carnea]|uniref:zinc finger protein OZF-like isoform X1 n=1 Tax=Chrysoperla carnea TaxID=189513 RepID=UPI001D08D633|nr:zinc finger protein OZF-like isoform X1 [Chrysoperla carnea]